MGVNIGKATFMNVVLDALRPSLAGSSPSPLTRDYQLGDSVDAGGGSFHMSGPPKPSTTENSSDVAEAELLQELF